MLVMNNILPSLSAVAGKQNQDADLRFTAELESAENSDKAFKRKSGLPVLPSHPVWNHFLPGHRFASREGLSQEGGHLRTRSNVLRLEFPEKTISLIPILSPFLQLKKGT